jgi:hypothetical protein
VRSSPGLARTILLFHIISARPPKQPSMVRTFLKVHTRPRLDQPQCRGSLSRSPSPPPPSFTQSPSPPRSLVRDGQTSPHRPRLVVSRSTCLPLSPSLHANSFVIGTAVINTHSFLCGSSSGKKTRVGFLKIRVKPHRWERENCKTLDDSKRQLKSKRKTTGKREPPYVLHPYYPSPLWKMKYHLKYPLKRSGEGAQVLPFQVRCGYGHD